MAFPSAPPKARAGETAPDKPSYQRHVVALFSRLGCNSGTCHGAVKGQNGFRLSLFGADPSFDHEQIVRDLGGRRVNRNDPAHSLLLLKATGQIDHGGGVRLRRESFEYQVLQRWLAAGAPVDPLTASRVEASALLPRNTSLDRANPIGFAPKRASPTEPPRT